MPAPAASEPAPPKTELQELQLKATEKTDEVSAYHQQVHPLREKFLTAIIYFSPWSQPAVCWHCVKR